MAVVAACVGLWGGTRWAGGEIRARLEAATQRAGLRLVLDDVDVSVAGTVQVRGLSIERAPGEAVVALALAEATLSPLDALAGQRRPDAVRLEGLKLDVRLVDGRPEELLRLARAARPRSTRVDGAPTVRRPPARLPALVIAGVDVDVHAEGRGAALLPDGLQVRGLSLTVGPDGADARGAGTLTTGKRVSEITVAASRADDGAAAVRVGLQPPIDLPVTLADALPDSLPLPPRLVALIADIQSMRLGSLAWRAGEGASVEDLALIARGEPLVTAARVVLLADVDDGDRTVRYGAELQDLDANLTEPSWRELLPRVPRLRAALEPFHGPLRAHVGGVSARILEGAAGANRDADAPPGAPRSDDLRLGLRDVRLQSPGWSAAEPAVKLTLDRLTADVATSALRDGIAAPWRVAVDGPAAVLRWEPAHVRSLPGGTLLARLVEPPTPVDPASVPDDPADGVDESLLPPEARRSADLDQPTGDKERDKRRRKERRKRRKRRGRSGRKGKVHATQAAIPVVNKQVEALLGLDAAIAAGLTRLDRAAGLQLEVRGGRFAAVAPAGAELAGLRALRVDWTPLGSDGTRALTLAMTPFDKDGEDGAIGFDLHSAHGRLSKLAFSASGRGPAALVAAALPWGYLGADARLKVDGELRFVRAVDAKAKVPAAPRTVGLRAHATLDAHHIGLAWWRIAPRPIVDLSATGTLRFEVSSADKRATLSTERLRLRSDASIDDDGAGVELEGTLGLEAVGSDNPQVIVKAAMPRQSCAVAARAIPRSMIPTIGTIAATGEAGWSVDIRVPLANPYKLKLDLSLDDETCEVTDFGSVDIAELGGDFERAVNENGTILEGVLVGPKTEHWAPLAEMKPWTPYAMIATEDGAFYKHRGLREGLLSRAMKMDLSGGRFLYGGSSITQQLVKNVYLTRAKYLVRKFEELLIVWQMERRLEKDRILELYVNMIEFGPQIYGIERAAQTYFGKKATALSPLESAFLAANKPCPNCGHKRFESKKWTPWWQSRMVGIMTKMRDNLIIDDAQFVAEAPYVPRFVGWEHLAPPPDQGPAAEPLGGVEE